MPHHNDASTHSQEFCLNLFDELSKYIPNLIRRETKIYCSFSAPKNRIFATVYHRKSDLIRVDFIGDGANQLKLPTDLPFSVRNQNNTTYPYYVEIDKADLIPSIARWLYTNIYPLSQNKSKKETNSTHRERSQSKYFNIADDIRKIEKDSSLNKTEKEQLIKARVGQGKFRKKLVKLSKCSCQITGCKIEELLIASHIKPWAASSNYERVDEYNGLLLTPNFDVLFDKGFISFDNSGNMFVSNKIPEKDKQIFGVSRTIKINLFKKNIKYLEFHQKNVFKR